MLRAFAPTEVEANVVDTCQIDDNKIISTCRDREGTALTSAMAELNTEPQFLEGGRLEKCAIPDL